MNVDKTALLLDELVIRNLLARFCELADRDSSVEKLAGLFAPDGEWRLGPEPWCGRAAISAGLVEVRRHGDVGPGSASQHIVTNIAVDIVGPDTAYAQSSLLLLGTGPAPVIRFVGRNEDVFRKIDDQWFIQQRLGHSD